MGQPITVTDGICFAFPDMLLTPSPGGTDIPVPYPNIARLSEAEGTSPDVLAGGKPVVLEDSTIPNSSGGEAGTSGGVISDTQLEECSFTGFSATVKANGRGVVRQGDPTEQNSGNTVGTVMAGVPTVLVGG
ncbi:DUF4150 domain-containing protein [Glutamicibacter sp. MNS18]|uniref:DUF4150 domain-containing protein n=1 Tax=Glutamicibacter sp. MNS18 TaxID=2989817 RepID=UPI002236A60C|nr:DUF4150 domain-containing protein [Glutamicibacter sp. MNS18]MCW4464559.1 DUF4150 domain-containing protein [Glutamicibacter sp. MNS18]